MDKKENECTVLYVKCRDANVKEAREATAGSVREYFERQFKVPTNLKVVCFL
jgi:hypothetical protein